MSACADVSGLVGEMVRDYVRGGRLMQVATCDRAGRPHLAHVWYSADEYLALTFMSNRSRVHSRHIREGRPVAGGIVDIDLEGLGQHVRGVTFEGTAREIAGADLEPTFRSYAGRWPHFEDMCSVEDLRSGRTPLGLYTIRPHTVVLFDALNFPDQPRQEITLTW